MRDFNHTVNVLVKAYLEGTLEHGNCYACAVGNIVAESTGKVFIRDEATPTEAFYGYRSLYWDGCEYPAHGGSTGGWGQVFTTQESDDDDLEYVDGKVQEIDLRFFKGEAKKQIMSTGYSVEDLAKIEFAFETCKWSSDAEERMFNGLMAVVDVLANIHGISLEQKSEAKAMFVKETV